MVYTAVIFFMMTGALDSGEIASYARKRPANSVGFDFSQDPAWFGDTTVDPDGYMDYDGKQNISTAGASKATNAAQYRTGNTDTEIFNFDLIRPMLKTESNTAFFWSGKTDGVGGAEVAAEIARGRKGVTLESTIASNEIPMPKWNFTDPVSMEAWDMASAAYAEQASGEVYAVIGSELRPGNIWENIELPRLMKNPNVTKIILVDPITGQETIIFER